MTFYKKINRIKKEKTIITMALLFCFFNIYGFGLKDVSHAVHYCVIQKPIPTLGTVVIGAIAAHQLIKFNFCNLERDGNGDIEYSLIFARSIMSTMLGVALYKGAEFGLGKTFISVGLVAAMFNFYNKRKD